MQRNTRQPVALVDMDFAVRIGGGVVDAEDRQRIGKGRADEGIAREPVKPAVAAVEACLKPDPLRLSGILKETGTHDRPRTDKDDVVIVLSDKRRHGPIDLEPAFACGQVAAGARFHRAGHDLLKRRVRDKGIGKAAWLVPVGAAQFRRRRHPVGFAIADIGRNAPAPPIGEAGGRVEAVEAVIAVEGGAVAILKLDTCVVETPGKREVELRRQRQRVGDEKAVIPVLCNDAGVEFVAAEKYPGGGNRAVGGELADLGVVAEFRAAVVDRAPDDQNVLAPRQIMLGAELQRGAIAVGLGACAVVDGKGLLADVISFDCRAGQVLRDIARAIFLAQQARIGIAFVDVGLVAVLGVTAQPTVIGVALERQDIGEPVLTAQLPGKDLVLRVVGIGEHRVAIDGEELDRRRAIAVEVTVGPQETGPEVEAFLANAEIGIGLAEIGLRLVAPPLFLKAADPRIEADRAVVDAILSGAAHPPERTARDFGFTALEGKAVAHVERDRTAQRVEPINRIERRDELQIVDREDRDEIEVYGVAEGIVDARAILINRQPLRQPEQGRRGEPAKAQLRLQWIILRVADRDTADPLIEKIVDAEGMQRIDLAALEHLHVGGHAVGRDAGAEHRRDRDHFDRRQHVSLCFGILRIRCRRLAVRDRDIGFLRRRKSRQESRAQEGKNEKKASRALQPRPLPIDRFVLGAFAQCRDRKHAVATPVLSLARGP